MVGEKNKKKIIFRPPVVVILGHVDHGKSSILEKIKDLKITAKESGGITQHIGAYEVEVPKEPESRESETNRGVSRQARDDFAAENRKITFIDTPGHEAFSAMRSRGAKVADIAILVVAADEGVKLQTKEAIKHVKTRPARGGGAKLPIIVAINKIDKPGADAEKVKTQLAKEEVLVESMGGKVPCVKTSAATGQGITELLEMVLLVAEMEDLKADLNEKAKGVVIESYLDSNRGPTATLILENGVLNKNDILGTNSTFGKIKIMEDFQGSSIDRALPSMPVKVLGFEKVPRVGEEFGAFDNIEDAKKKVSHKQLSSPARGGGAEDVRGLNIILKTDVLGSLEAIEQALKDIPEDKVVLRILKAGVGEINDSDVKLAEGARAVIVGFRVKANQIAQKLAQRNNIKIISFEVIYELVQALRELLEKRIEPELVRVDLGKVEILTIFRIEKKRQIIGGKVREGKIQRAALVDVYRNEEKIGQGKVVNLKRDQNEVGLVEKGKDCGILYEGDVEVKERDVLDVYVRERRKAGL